MGIVRPSLGLLFLFVLPAIAKSAVLIGGPTTDWTPIPIGAQNDFLDDNQTGGDKSEADIVGTNDDPGFYSQFDDAGTADKTDGCFALRVRLGADAGSAGFGRVFFAGLDVNDDGAIDFYVGVDNQGSSDRIVIWESGGGVNNSPDTVDLGTEKYVAPVSATNYNWSAVNNTIDPRAVTDIDDDKNDDHFLSFQVPFAEIVTLAAPISPGFDENASFRYIIGTSTQTNSFNQDIGGVNGEIGSSSTFTSLGAVSAPFTATGASGAASAPEPQSLAIFGAAGFLFWRRRSQEPTQPRSG